MFAVCSHDTMSGTAEPLQAFCFNPTSDFAMCNQMMMAHLRHAMSPFGLKLVSQRFDGVL
jgi:hypothetical protein